MAKTANQLIKQAYEIAKTMPPAQAAIIKELATVLDVSNVALRQTRTERDALLAEVKSWAKECDRLTERSHQESHKYACSRGYARFESNLPRQLP